MEVQKNEKNGPRGTAPRRRTALWACGSLHGARPRTSTSGTRARVGRVGCTADSHRQADIFSCQGAPLPTPGAITI